jgi:Xaa-Pro aminopeptidase
MKKSEEEINITRQACDITAKAFRRCLSTVKPDMYEYEVQAEIEYICKQNNATGHAYAPIIAGGKNACCLHYSKNQSILNDGDLLLFDIGCEYYNYSSDLSRTIPINGKFSTRQKECYNLVLDVMKEITKLYRPGHCINEVNQAARQLMGENSKYLMHGVSHHIGLDVHDSIDKFKTFEPGMILTCEPGIYIREEGIGIRIENDLLITEGEPVNLFAGLPIEIEEIEAAMQR